MHNIFFFFFNQSKGTFVLVYLKETACCRHLHTIALQIEVTQFLGQCLGSRSGEAAAVATQFVAQAKSSTVIPTLFGNQDQRRDVVKMVRSLSGCESMYTGTQKRKKSMYGKRSKCTKKVQN